MCERLNREHKERTDFTLIMAICTEHLQLQVQLLALSRLYSDEKLIFILKIELRSPFIFYLKMSRYLHINSGSLSMSGTQRSYVISLSH